MSDARRLFGTDEAPDAPTPLRVGPVSALFLNGALRRISYGGLEVVRGVHFLVRDRHWATVAPRILDVGMDRSEDRLRLTYRAEGRTPADDRPIGWSAAIDLTPEGMSFEAEARSDEDFVTCRTGFVVLHPLEGAVGRAVTVTHPDGRTTRGAFPDLVDPLQSFFDVAAMEHEPAPGLRVSCRMEGGSWETEDHRNWMDASFKTYFRALALPKPYTIPAGEPVAQAVRVSVASAGPVAAPAEEAPFVTLGDRTGGRWPALGLWARGDDLDDGLARAGALAAVRPAFLAFRVRTDGRDLPGQLRGAAELARALGTGVDLEVVVAERGEPVGREVELVALAARMAGLRPGTVAAASAPDLKDYPPSADRPPGPSGAELRAALAGAFPGARIGGGTLAYFPELNRRRPAPGSCDVLQWGTNSLTHAADDLSVMETLETIPHQVRSARAMLPGVPIRLGPVGIAMPMNPYGDALDPNPDGRRLTVASRDPRQGGQFGAAFLAGYLARAAQAGVDEVTAGAVAGGLGLAGPDGPLPALAVVARMAGLGGAAALQAASSAPQRFLVAACDAGGRRHAVLASLEPVVATVALRGWPIAAAGVLSAAGPGFRPVPAGPAIELPPYGVAWLEG